MGAEGAVSHKHTVAQHLLEAGASLIELETVSPYPKPKCHHQTIKQVINPEQGS
jgi:hypothetical protein